MRSAKLSLLVLMSGLILTYFLSLSSIITTTSTKIACPAGGSDCDVTPGTESTTLRETGFPFTVVTTTQHSGEQSIRQFSKLHLAINYSIGTAILGLFTILGATYAHSRH